MSNTKKSWFDELTEAMKTSFAHAHEEMECPRSAVASVKFNDGSFIDVELFPNNSVDVYTYHADGRDRECPNIVAYIEDNLPDWDVLAEEWDENNELLETDYLQFYGIL